MVAQVVIVGAGVAGLSAARRLLDADPQVRVTVLEAEPEPGGQVRTATTPDGLAVDLGVEALPLDDPELHDLIHRLQLTELVRGRPDGPVLVADPGGRLHTLPAGVGPLGPTRLGPLVRSGLLTMAGAARAALEPRLRHRRFPDDIALGNLAQLRFGRQVRERLVDPLVGNQYGANVLALGIRDNFPELDPIARSGRSQVIDAAENPGRHPDWPGHVGALAEGNRSLIDALVDHPRLRLLTDSPATGVTPEGSGARHAWLVHTATGLHPADAVVVTAPGAATGELVGEFSPRLKVALQWVRTASVSTVAVGIDGRQVKGSPALRRATGILLGADRRRLLGTVSTLAQRWRGRASDEVHVVRLTAGRSTSTEAVDLDDDTLAGRLVSELGTLIGRTITPRWTMVHKFVAAMPQLGTAHGERVAAARAELTDQHPGLEVAGCFVDGPGVGRAAGSGRAAADRLLTTVLA